MNDCIHLKKLKTWEWLGYLGLIPFVTCLWIFKLKSNDEINHLFFNPQQAFQFYSVIILTFLAGALWKQGNSHRYSTRHIISNLLCLYAYLWLFMPLLYALIFLPLGYVAMLVSEYFLVEKGKTTNKRFSDYYTMRLTLTFSVITLHAIALIAWF